MPNLLAGYSARADTMSAHRLRRVILRLASQCLRSAPSSGTIPVARSAMPGYLAHPRFRTAVMCGDMSAEPVGGRCQRGIMQPARPTDKGSQLRAHRCRYGRPPGRPPWGWRRAHATRSRRRRQPTPQPWLIPAPISPSCQRPTQPRPWSRRAPSRRRRAALARRGRARSRSGRAGSQQ